jgi:nucleoid DNA-binding protein
MKTNVISKAHLVRKISKEANITNSAARTAIDVIYATIYQAVEEDKYFRIPDVGLIQSKVLKPRNCLNPNTGERFITKPKRVANLKIYYRKEID